MSKQDIFKTGSTFGGQFTLRDPATKKGIAITSNMGFACMLETQHGKHVATLQVTPDPDQVARPGLAYITFSGDTTSWPIGILVTDLQVSIGGVIKHTGTMSFPVERGISRGATA